MPSDTRYVLLLHCKIAMVRVRAIVLTATPIALNATRAEIGLNSTLLDEFGPQDEALDAIKPAIDFLCIAGKAD